MILLVSTIAAGLVAWLAIAAGIAVVLGRVIVKRDEQVAADAEVPVPHPGVSQRPHSVRSSADAIERSGS